MHIQFYISFLIYKMNNFPSWNVIPKLDFNNRLIFISTFQCESVNSEVAVVVSEMQGALQRILL